MVAINYTTDMPRWAEVDVDAGYSSVTYTTDDGTTVATSAYTNPVMCTGNRLTGTLYYATAVAIDDEWPLFKKNITGGNQSAATKIFTAPSRISFLAANDDAEGVYVRTGAGVGNISGGANTYNAYIAPSLEALPSTQPVNSDTTGGISWFNRWIKNCILVGTKFYDLTGAVYRELPSNVVSGVALNRYIFNGNDTDGYFICRQAHGENGVIEFFSYDWDSQQATLIFSTTASALPSATGSTGANGNPTACIIDPEHEALIVLPNDTSATNALNFGAFRTTDAVNFSPRIPDNPTLGTGEYRSYHQNHFQHVNLSLGLGSGMGGTTGNGWDGNEDFIFTSSSLIPSIPGAANSSRLYAGKEMFVNGTRLYDIVPREGIPTEIEEVKRFLFVGKDYYENLHGGHALSDS